MIYPENVLTYLSSPERMTVEQKYMGGSQAMEAGIIHMKLAMFHTEKALVGNRVINDVCSSNPAISVILP